MEKALSIRPGMFIAEIQEKANRDLWVEKFDDFVTFNLRGDFMLKEKLRKTAIESIMAGRANAEWLTRMTLNKGIEATIEWISHDLKIFRAEEEKRIKAEALAAKEKKRAIISRIATGVVVTAVMACTFMLGRLSAEIFPIVSML